VISAVTALPVIYRPSQKHIFPIVVSVATVNQIGSIVINTNGTMTIAIDSNSTGFGINVLTSGVPTATTITYLLS
jgi:hypothetical protein